MEVNQILYEWNVLGSVGEFKCMSCWSLEYPYNRGTYIRFTEIYRTNTLPNGKEVETIKTGKKNEETVIEVHQSQGSKEADNRMKE